METELQESTWHHSSMKLHQHSLPNQKSQLKQPKGSFYIHAGKRVKQAMQQAPALLTTFSPCYVMSYGVMQ